MNMPVSSSTLIRSLHAEPIPEIQASTIIGLDDWAYRKGRKYGTVLVDLEKQKIIDLLPDRESSTVEKWLRDHPQIKIVSRDRYANYAIGINKALPEAIHVADRWHLIKNLGEVVKKVLDRVRVALKQKAKMLYAPQYSTPISRAALPTRTIQSLERKQKLIDEVKRLFGQGVSMLAISKTLQLNRITVKSYLSLEKAMPKNCISRTNLHLFENYIRDAVAKRPGVLIRDLYHEIKAMGYDGSRSVGYARIGNYMNTFSQEHYLKDIPQANWKPADVSFLFYKKASELHSRERDIVNYIINVSGEAETCYLLFQRFREMIENKDGAGLDKWIKDAKATLIKEFHTFSLGVLNDFSAVQNAFNLPWSNGQVEGQVNKLKMIKRQMYGRASFNLLRKRLVCIE